MSDNLDEEKYPLPDLPHGYRWVLKLRGESIRVSLQRHGAIRWKEVAYDTVYTFQTRSSFIRDVEGVLREAIAAEDKSVDSKYPLGITYGTKKDES